MAFKAQHSLHTDHLGLAFQRVTYFSLPASEPPVEPTAEALVWWGRHY